MSNIKPRRIFSQPWVPLLPWCVPRSVRSFSPPPSKWPVTSEQLQNSKLFKVCGSKGGKQSEGKSCHRESAVENQNQQVKSGGKAEKKEVREKKRKSNSEKNGWRRGLEENSEILENMLVSTSIYMQFWCRFEQSSVHLCIRHCAPLILCWNLSSSELLKVPSCCQIEMTLILNCK